MRVEVDTAAELYVAIGKLIRVLRQESGGLPLGPGAMGALMTLSRHPDGLRLGALAEAEGVRPPSLTRIVAALEEAGHVVREPDPEDGRASRVTITASGRELILGGQDTRIALLRERIDRLDAASRRRLDAALPALVELVAEQT